jgi:hypothetical protein
MDRSARADGQARRGDRGRLPPRSAATARPRDGMDHWIDRVVTCCRPPYSSRLRYWRRTRSVCAMHRAGGPIRPAHERANASPRGPNSPSPDARPVTTVCTSARRATVNCGSSWIMKRKCNASFPRFHCVWKSLLQDHRRSSRRVRKTATAATAACVLMPPYFSRSAPSRSEYASARSRQRRPRPSRRSAPLPGRQNRMPNASRWGVTSRPARSIAKGDKGSFARRAPGAPFLAACGVFQQSRAGSLRAIGQRPR